MKMYALLALILLCCLVMSGCKTVSGPLSNYGISVGETTAEEVEEILGTPAIIEYYSGEGYNYEFWIYRDIDLDLGERIFQYRPRVYYAWCIA